MPARPAVSFAADGSARRGPRAGLAANLALAVAGRAVGLLPAETAEGHALAAEQIAAWLGELGVERTARRR